MQMENAYCQRPKLPVSCTKEVQQEFIREPTCDMYGGPAKFFRAAAEDEQFIRADEGARLDQAGADR
jgi:hypothetical protein